MAAALIRIGLLGPPTIWRGSEPLPLPAEPLPAEPLPAEPLPAEPLPVVPLPAVPRQRLAVLAVLAVHRNEPVTRDRLIDAVWGGSAPRSAANRIHVHVCALRRLLEPERPSRAAGTVISRAGSTYRLALARGQLDLDDFDAHLDRAAAARAAGDLDAAVSAADDALGLWRGEALDGIAGAWAEAERARLRELRLSTVEQRAEDLLAIGRPDALTTELGALVAAYPYRERLAYLLIRALHAVGRRAEALQAYAATRSRLIDDLGVEPGRALRGLHHEILTSDPSS
jgi:DNA-binding SARP family transcriptional activator